YAIGQPAARLRDFGQGKRILRLAVVLHRRQSGSSAGAARSQCRTPVRSVAHVVIMVGRKRKRHASRVAAIGGRLRSRSATIAKSTRMMPFFLTMPMSRRFAPKGGVFSQQENKQGGGRNMLG